MMSTALPNRRRAVLAAGALAVATAVLGMGSALAEASEAAASPTAAETPSASSFPSATESQPFAGRFPDVVLRTHDGRNVRFYSDLLEGKIVLINFMYATCTER